MTISKTQKSYSWFPGCLTFCCSQQLKMLFSYWHTQQQRNVSILEQKQSLSLTHSSPLGLSQHTPIALSIISLNKQRIMCSTLNRHIPVHRLFRCLTGWHVCDHEWLMETTVQQHPPHLLSHRGSKRNPLLHPYPPHTSTPTLTNKAVTWGLSRHVCPLGRAWLCARAGNAVIWWIYPQICYLLSKMPFISSEMFA